MPVTTRAILKSFFETGDRPTQAQFAALIDSMTHKSDGFVITSHIFNPNGDVSINFSDGSSLDFNVPQSADISFINGLQNALNAKVEKVVGQTLTDNNFTQSWIDIINGLVLFVQNLNGFNGDLSSIEVTLTYPVDTAAQSVGERVSDLPVFSIGKGQLLMVNFYLNEPSDGMNSYVQKTQTFALPAGNYGTGGLAVSENNRITNYRDAIAASSVILDSDYPLLGLPYTEFNGQMVQHNKQQQFNEILANRSIAINDNPLKNKALVFDANHSAQWEQIIPIDWSNGNIFKISSKINVLDTPNAVSNWSSILQLDNEDLTDNTIIRGIYVGLIKNGSLENYKIEISLIEIKNNTYYKSWSFTTQDWTPTGEIEFDFNIEIDDFATELFLVDIFINEKVSLYDYTSYNGAYGLIHPPQNNRIAWASYYKAHFEMDYLKYTIDGETTDFHLDEPESVPPMALNGVCMDIYPNNHGNRLERIKNGSLYVMRPDGSLTATTIDKIFSRTDSELITIGDNNKLFETLGGYNNFTIKKIGSIVYLRGEWENPTSLILNDFNQIMILPLGFRPQDYTIIPVKNEDDILGELHISISGLVRVKATGGQWESGLLMEFFPAINFLTRI